ncbi:MAG TPA: xanthine dehydrogenase family protein molybdopterin-binding subunit, partial [Burkholderiales bacterium]|nr:xanthine dehydrogenase family protein molybdopterin-binding subunit [Burkholderiales bacterium]
MDRPRSVGAAVKRLEDPAILAGRGRYVDDLALPGMLEVAFVRSSEAHALIKGIRLEDARALPGVHSVLLLKDLGADKRMVQANPHPLLRQNLTQYPLARDEVCYVGETIAMVLAENRYLAEDAASLVQVDYEPLPAAVDVRDAAQPGAAKVHRDSPDNLVARIPWKFGDADAVFASCRNIFRESYIQHRGGCHSMECRGVVASHDAFSDRLTLWSSTQSPYLIRRFLAQYLLRDENRIRVIAPDVGGGFGPKAAHYPEELALALAALKTGRPLKWIEDRREHFVATTQQRDQLWDVEVACDDAGKVLAIRARALHDHGAYVPYGLLLALGSVVNFPGTYAIPAVDIAIDVVFTNAVPTTPIRGAGRPYANFILERTMDCVARNLKLDRAEVRRRNLIRKDQMPYSTGGKLPTGKPVMFDSGDYPGTLERVLRNSNYPEKRAQSGRLVGIGMSCYNEDTGLAPFEGATVRVFPSGKVVVTSGAGAQGQGVRTILAQIAAEQLGVPPADVAIEFGDTAAFPMGMSTVGSRTTVTAGSSVHLAALEVRDKAIRLAAEALECASADLELAEGAVRIKGVPDKRVPLGELARRLAGQVNVPTPAGFSPGLEATAYHAVERPVYANGANVAVVEVDPDTGRVWVRDYFVVHDCGTLVNPTLVDGQIAGGVAHGISNVLFERMVYDRETGQPQTTNYGEYLLVSAPEMPRLHLAHTETPSPWNPLGVKGAGEGGTIPCLAA